MKAKGSQTGPVHGFGEDAPEIPMIVREHPINGRGLPRILHPCEQRLYCRVHRHTSPLSRFRFVNREPTDGPVHVRPCETQQFPLPQPPCEGPWTRSDESDQGATRAIVSPVSR